MINSIYPCSKIKYAAMWRKLRGQGLPINAYWLDNQPNPAKPHEFAVLWEHCIYQAQMSDLLLLYREPEEILKGAWAELGAALSFGTRVFAVGIREFTIAHHPQIVHFDNLDAAVTAVRAEL